MKILTGAEAAAREHTAELEGFAHRWEAITQSNAWLNATAEMLNASSMEDAVDFLRELVDYAREVLGYEAEDVGNAVDPLEATINGSERRL